MTYIRPRPKKKICVFTVSRPTLIFSSDLMNFYTEFGQPFLLFNQQQCFIYSTASFLSKLRAKKVEKLHNFVILPEISKKKYRNEIPERLFSVLPIINNNKKKKMILTDRPQIFLTCDSKHTYIFFWPQSRTIRTQFFFTFFSEYSYIYYSSPLLIKPFPPRPPLL